jgi:HEAT repeat protein
MRVKSVWVLIFILNILVFCAAPCDLRAQENISLLINRLGNSDEKTQLDACRALRELGNDAVQPLIDAMNKHKDATVRKNCAITLGMIHAPEAFDTLVLNLKDTNGMVRWAAAWALGELGDAKAIDPLCDTLKDPVWTVRMRAAEALGKIGSERAVAYLFPLLKDNQEKVREAVKAALEKIKTGK